MQSTGKKSIKVSVLVKDVPPPEKTKASRKCIEDQVRERIEHIDNGCASHVDFLLLMRLQKSLKKRTKKSPRVKNLIKMIEPVLNKFGYYF